ncbi:MAG: transposase [Collinsella sp.]
MPARSPREVAALQSIKGCAFALAAAFSAEVGDFTRFRSGRQVTAYFGLAPSQRSSGDSVRLGRHQRCGQRARGGSWPLRVHGAAAARHQPEACMTRACPCEISDAREEGVRAASCGGARRCSPAACPRPAAKGQRGHRGRAREVSWGPRHDVPEGAE